MENIRNKEITVGLDIGTTKLCAIVARKSSEKGLEILGLGISPSNGLNRGVVVNIDKTVKSIKLAVENAEQQAGIKIKDVVVGIAGDHIESYQTRGIVSVANPENEVSQEDVDRLLADTRKVAIPAEREIIHVIPQDFIIDGQDGIYDPVGMSGVRIEANVHIVTGLKTAIQNIHRCVQRAGLNVKEIVLEPIASSYSVLTEEEKEVGVALVDIGGGTTDIAIFDESIIRFTAVIGIAGRQVTDDIRRGLGIVVDQAEKIKREYGHAYEKSILQDDVFMVPGIGGRAPMEITKSSLCMIIQPRMEEILEFAKAEIEASGYKQRLGAGVVLTGGTTLLKGTEELAQKVFNIPVKMGIPSGISHAGLAPEIESPVFSTAVGLAISGMKSKIENKIVDAMPEDININQDEKEAQQAEKLETEEKEAEEIKTEMTEEQPKEKKSFMSKIKDFLSEL